MRSIGKCNNDLLLDSRNHRKKEITCHYVSSWMGSNTWFWVEAVCKTSEQLEKVNEWSSWAKNYGNLMLKWPSARCLIPVCYRKAAYLQETGDDCGSSELPSVVTSVTLSVIAGSRTGSDPWWEAMPRDTLNTAPLGFFLLSCLPVNTMA